LAESGQKVVQCHGCFDIVHPGHIRYLEFASQQGDVLIISVTNDSNVTKGIKRPYIPENLRAENLAALEIVDYVVIDEHAWAGPILEALKPDVYVKGKEYETKSDPRFRREKEIVESYGGEVVFSSGDVVYSSSYIIEEFQDRFDLERQKIREFRRRHGIKHEQLLSDFESIADSDVVVLGDPILDQYIRCEEKTAAAEGATLSVSPMEDERFLGAAGLMAAQLSNLGSNVTLVSPVGKGDAASCFRRKLRGFDIELCTVADVQRPVFEKKRYLVDEQKLLKVNRGKYSPISNKSTAHLIDQLEFALQGADALIVTDFGYGLFGPQLVSELNRSLEAANIPYFVDVSSGGASNLLDFEKPRVATPTEEELRFALGDQESGLSHLAVQYFEETRAERLVLTLGKEGAILFEPPDVGAGDDRCKTEYLPAFTKRPVDPIGAGDVFLTGYVGLNLAGREPNASAYGATFLATLHANRIGNAPVSFDRIERYLKRYRIE
jgi:rfaE bifunctional protein kinase chain/domain/rfaE bifunctional protein nucleotidyltransferase chain/domain